jgi:hypothetical protein
MLVPLQTPVQQIECPHCRRHSIVKHGESEYVCLNCNFRKDLTHGSLGEAFGRFPGLFFLALVALGIAVVFGS